MFREWMRRLLGRSRKPPATTPRPGAGQSKLPAVSWIDGSSNAEMGDVTIARRLLAKGAAADVPAEGPYAAVVGAGTK